MNPRILRAAPAIASTANAASYTLPKVLSAKVHHALDLAIAGSLAAGGAWYWNRNRHAAIASWACGGAMLGLTLLTSYPGKGRRYLKFRLHGKVERAMAALVAAIPTVLRVEDERQRLHFEIEAGLLTAVSNLTSFEAAE